MERLHDRKTVLVASEQPILRAGNQVLYLTVLGYLRSGFDVILLLREWRGAEVADPYEVFGDYSGRLRVVEFRRLGDRTRDLVLRIFSRTQGGAQPIEPAYPRPEEVLPFAATAFRAGRLLSLVGSVGYLVRGLWTGLRVAMANRIDLVCGYEVHAVPIAWLLAWLLGVPLVVKYAGTFLCNYHPSRWRMFIHFPAQYVGTVFRADLVIIEDDGTRGRDVLLRLGHPADRIRTWLGGVRKDFRIDRFDRTEVLARLGIRAEPQPKLILSSSLLIGWKRPDRAVTAMRAVISQCPDAYLVLANGGRERERLERFARQLGVSDRVIFTGPVPHGEMKFLLNACDVFISVNDNTNLSNTVLEALVCAKPVVTIDDGSSDGLLDHEWNALLVPLEQVATELPRAILRILENPSLAAALGQRALETAKARLLSWDERIELEMAEVSKLLA
jgi:glycosyltransferase involved in cell wall biosynthesis